ncbi:hypothetical protein P3T39_006936 [Kitasatospora sp. GP82]|nr:hypothetical protein [Kitasatospora sp. GP82]
MNASTADMPTSNDPELRELRASRIPAQLGAAL